MERIWHLTSMYSTTEGFPTEYDDNYVGVRAILGNLAHLREAILFQRRQHICSYVLPMRPFNVLNNY